VCVCVFVCLCMQERERERIALHKTRPTHGLLSAITLIVKNAFKAWSCAYLYLIFSLDQIKCVLYKSVYI